MKKKSAPKSKSASITNPAILPIEAAAFNYADARLTLTNRLNDLQPFARR